MVQLKASKLIEGITSSYRFMAARYAALERMRFFRPFLLGVLILLTFMWAWTFLHDRLGEHFSQDSFGYFLLSKNIFSGLGFTSFSARDFSVEPVWPVVSKSFPPLHPLLVGFVNFITGLGMRSASLISLFFLGGTIVTMFFFTRELDRESWLMLFFAFVLFFSTNKFYREEMEAGRSIPGMMLFFFLAVMFFLKTLDEGGRKIKYEILSGALLAAMLHQRFDQTLFCLAFLFFVFFIYKLKGFSTRESLVRTGTIAGTFFILSLPWAIRNMVQFGVPFASDNTGSVKTTFTGLFCNSFWLPGKEPPTIFTHPDRWLDQRERFLLRNFDKIVVLSRSTIYLVPIAVLAMWKTLTFKQRVFAFFMVVSFATTLTTISLTPFGDHRYFSLVHLNLFIVLALCISNAFKSNSTKPIRRFVHVTLVLVLLCSTFTGKRGVNIREDFFWGNLIPNNLEVRRLDYKNLNKQLFKYVKGTDILSIKPHAERYTYFTNRRTVYVPSTLGRNQRLLYEWVKRWDVDYMFIYRKNVKQLRLGKFVVAHIRGRPLVDCKAFLKEKRNIFENKQFYAHKGKPS